mgnify:CR=1 FL=1
MLSVALGCPYEGDVPEDRIRDLTRTMFDAGATEVIMTSIFKTGFERFDYGYASAVSFLLFAFTVTLTIVHVTVKNRIDRT